MPGMTTEQTIASLMTGFLPLLISFVLRPTWSSRTRTLVAFVIVLATVILLQMIFIMTGSTPGDWRSWATFFVSCLVMTTVSYQSLWKNTGVAARVEVASSPPSPARRELLAEADRKSSPPRDAEGGE